ncbi:arabinogalactan endo-1,4-beta-galactosidase [Clavulina sp. PMI_390]|nr:arabinogalactan endo-1,4-beta-galactosidase [Clavulina sp. PMI_390]
MLLTQTFSRILLLACGVSALTYKGADISSVPVSEAAGTTFKDTNGVAGKAETILKNHGMNSGRVRIWTAGTYNLAYGLALGKRIKAAGMTLLVDLHYSDTWADPGHQAIPSGWGSTVSALNTNIYTYTQSVVSAFNAQGTPIDILAIGNEINNGFLWNVGALPNYDSISQMLHSARSGATAGGFTGKAMIHLADGWKDNTWWYTDMIRSGELSTSDFDIMGFSFYPFYNTGATLSALQTSLTTIVNKYGKDVIIAETDWPATSCSTAMSASYPDSPTGQLQWISGITSVLNALPGGHGKGIYYWEPTWLQNANLGSSCADNLLFDSSGTARSSVA